MELSQVESTFETLRNLIHSTPASTWELFMAYPQPPVEFVKVITQFIFILYSSEVQNWWECRKFLARDDIARRVSNIEPENVSPNQINRVRGKLEDIDSEVVEQMSHVGYTIYRWLMLLTKHNDILLLSRRVSGENLSHL